MVAPRELAWVILEIIGKGINGLHIMPMGWEEIMPRIVTEAGLMPAVINVSGLNDKSAGSALFL